MAPRSPSAPPPPGRLRLAFSVGATVGIFLFALACATPTSVRPPMPIAVIAMPSVAPLAPVTAAVHRTTGPWTRRRLGYTALTYEMPDVPEVLRLDDDDHCELARIARDGGRVRYEIRSFEHPVVALQNVEQLVAGSLTETARRVGGVRRNQTNLTQGGYPGADLTFDFTQANLTAHVRMLIGRTRSYCATVWYPTAADALLRGDVERFLRGMEFDEGDLPEADGTGALGEAVYVEPVGAWFAARMPGRPHRESHTFVVRDVTRPRVTYTVGSPDGRERYVVAVTAFERGVPQGALDAAVAAWTADGATVRALRPIAVQGYGGRAYTLGRDGDAKVTEARVFVTGSRIYELLATHPRASGDPSEARVQTFFDSLRIL